MSFYDELSKQKAEPVQTPYTEDILTEQQILDIADQIVRAFKHKCERASQNGKRDCIGEYAWRPSGFERESRGYFVLIYNSSVTDVDVPMWRMVTIKDQVQPNLSAKKCEHMAVLVKERLLNEGFPSNRVSVTVMSLTVYGYKDSFFFGSQRTDIGTNHYLDISASW